MDALSAVIYGIIQGLMEFLPVSSSAHLAVLPKFMNIADPGIAFDLAMHLGTALAVIIYFRKYILNLIKVSGVAINFTNIRHKNPDVYFVRNFIISTFFTFLLILVFKDAAEEYGRSPKLIAINLIVFGIIMYLVDRKSKTLPEHLMEKSMQPAKSVFIGVSQALAIFPGVSRSGITITAGRFLGLSREDAASYSFLLSLPVILGGVLADIPTYHKHGLDIGPLYIWPLSIGVCFLVGILTIHFFMKLVARIGLGWFSLYRIMLALLILFL